MTVTDKSTKTSSKSASAIHSPSKPFLPLPPLICSLCKNYPCEKIRNLYSKNIQYQKIEKGVGKKCSGFIIKNMTARCAWGWKSKKRCKRCKRRTIYTGTNSLGDTFCQKHHKIIAEGE